MNETASKSSLLSHPGAFRHSHGSCMLFPFFKGQRMKKRGAILDTPWICSSGVFEGAGERTAVVTDRAILLLGLFNARICAAQTTEDQSSTSRRCHRQMTMGISRMTRRWIQPLDQVSNEQIDQVQDKEYDWQMPVQGTDKDKANNRASSPGRWWGDKQGQKGNSWGKRGNHRSNRQGRR